MLDHARTWTVVGICMVSTVVAEPALAQLWGRNSGPEGALIQTLAVDPTHPATVYAGAYPAGAFKTTNGGTTWTPIFSGLPATQYVASLAIDPTTPTTVYAGTSGGAFKTTDGGTSWVGINSGLTNTAIRSLKMDPTNPSILYCAGSGGVSKTTDGGASWTAVTSGLPVGDGFLSLAIDPDTPSTVYVGTYANGVFKTTNAGASWTAVNNGLTTTRVWALAADPVNPGTVYAGTDQGVPGIFQTTDGGGTWTPLNSGPSAGVYALVIDSTHPNNVYAGVNGGVYKTTDTGATWSAVNSGLGFPSTFALAMDPTNPAILYAGTSGNGIFKTTTSAASWTAIDAGLTNTETQALVIDPSNPSTLYVAADYIGVFKTTTAGGSWNAVNNGLAQLFVQSLAIDPATPSTLYAGTYTGSSGGTVFKTTDGGGSWATANSGLPDSTVNTLVVHPTTTNTVYAGTRTGVFRTTDAGGSWVAANAGLTSTYVDVLVIDPQNPTTLYAGTNGDGVFKTADSGNSWSPMNVGMTGYAVYSLVVDPTNVNILYAGAYLGNSAPVFKSTDGGAHWTALSGSPGIAESLAIDPSAPATLYAGTNGLGVFKTTDGGGTWTAINAGLENPWVFALAIDPTHTTTVYAGTYGRGVFVQTCGNGQLEAGEQCDDGNLTAGDCCSPLCQFEGLNSPCASDGNVCTVDQCDGAGTCAHFAGNTGAVCRSAAGGCDVAEVCNGLSSACPPDFNPTCTPPPVSTPTATATPPPIATATATATPLPSGSGNTPEGQDVTVTTTNTFTDPATGKAVNLRVDVTFSHVIGGHCANDLTKTCTVSTASSDCGPGNTCQENTTVTPLTPPTGPVPAHFSVDSGQCSGKTGNTCGLNLQCPSGQTCMFNPALYFDVSTTAQTPDPIHICVHYTDSGTQNPPSGHGALLTGTSVNELSLALFHKSALTGQMTNVTAAGYPDPLTNTLCGTVTDLSPFAVAVFTNIPGGGKAATDCISEWNAGVQIGFTRQGLPKSRVVCKDGDACDADGTVNGQCQFNIDICPNVADPRLPDCAPTDVARYTLVRPSITAKDAISRTNAAAVLNALGQLGSVSPIGKTVTFSAPVTDSACATGASVTVPHRTARAGKRTIKLQALTSAGKTDTDVLTLVCQP